MVVKSKITDYKHILIQTHYVPRRTVKFLIWCIWTTDGFITQQYSFFGGVVDGYNNVIPWSRIVGFCDYTVVVILLLMLYLTSAFQTWIKIHIVNLDVYCLSCWWLNKVTLCGLSGGGVVLTGGGVLYFICKWIWLPVFVGGRGRGLRAVCAHWILFVWEIVYNLYNNLTLSLW